ncbi:MAG TPA: ATP-binding cassette domain-containing protein [Niabella sp.]|nr:ATP-binding cassette domain-containing protein [Niabella sp.]
MLQTNNIQFSYPAVQFRFPDIQCKAGDILLITGSSGKGKTTLLHLLAGLLKPQSGHIYIDGTDITALHAGSLDKFRGQKTGIIFQQSHFVASLSVIENLLLAPYLTGIKTNKERAKELLTQLNIAEQANKKPSRLSQGQLQRASIARALMNNPAVILADEPTSSLDDENCHKVATLLQEQAAITNAALVIVTHDQRLKQLFHQKIELL